MLDVCDLGVLPALFLQVADVVVAHPLDKVDHLGIEEASLLDLLLVVVVDLAQSVHVLDVLPLDAVQLAQELHDLLVVGVALVLRVAGDLPRGRSLQLVAVASVGLLDGLGLYLAHLEALTSQLGCTAPAVVHALVLDLDGELGRFVGMVDAHFSLVIILHLGPGNVPTAGWLLGLLVHPLARLPAHSPNGADQWLLDDVLAGHHALDYALRAPQVVVAQHVLLVGQHAYGHFADGS